MSKKRRKGGIGAKFFAAVLTAALTFSNVSTALPGGMTLAEEEVLLQAQTFSEIKEEVDAEIERKMDRYVELQEMVDSFSRCN